MHAGYGKHFPNRFYLGAEVYGYLSNNNKTNNSGLGLVTKAQRTNGFGIVVRPGMVFGNALFFVKAGVGSAQMKYSAAIVNFTTGAIASSGHKKQRVVEFPVGAGVDFLINDKFMLGVEGTYTITKERKFSIVNAAGAVVNGNVLKFKTNDLKAGVRLTAKL